MRGFKLVYGFLVLNFAIPAIGYAVAPAAAIAQFERIGILLGGERYAAFAGELGYVWRILAAGNVLALAFMCALLWWDVRRFYAVLWPLVFMKGFSTLANLAVYLCAYRYPAFLAVFLYDGVTVAAMVYFARAARG